MQANPAPSHERMVVVDVLRAVALFGIIITHAVDGFLAGPPPGPEFMLFSPLDRAVAQLANLLAFGKFYTIFSFLFGLSFAIQISNASRKGVGFSGRFAWRLGVLGLIALAHSAIFTGDILIIYAILGLLLIPFRKLKTRTLLIVATVLVLNVPGILLGVAMLSAAPTPEQVQANAEMQAQFMQAGLRQYEIKQSGTILELAQVSLSTGLLSKMAFMIFSGRLWITFGLFLLGICAGRMEIFRDTEANRQFFRRLFWPSAVVALITTVVAIIKPASMQVASLGNLLASFSFAVQNLALSVFYLAGVTLLFWRQPTRGWLPALAPVGKMGLTTYLGQSVLALLFFYGVGLGMIGRMGAAAAVGVGIAFFILQILFAHFWLRHFSLGPAEWLWRSLTYFKLHPNSRGAASATQAP